MGGHSKDTIDWIPVMNEPLSYSCICGAAGDVGELEEHCLEKFRSVEDQQDHQIIGVEEPVSITEARQSWQELFAIQNRLVEVFEAPIEKIRQALLQG
jgi:hypothetical protein